MIRYSAEERETLRQARALRRREVQAAKTTREPQEATGRRAMTTSRRQRIIDRDGQVCRYPECETTAGLEVDHIVCLELGGKEEDRNLQLLCGPHHKQKTAIDKKLIAKARRNRKNESEPRAPSKIPGRGFPAVSRPFPTGRGFSR
jgi:5-methylcytosine-specific restriction endonuclease McrA